MASGGAQDPFAAQRLGSFYQQAYGTNDPAVLNAARMAAVAELGEPQVNEILKRAASGDPQAREVAQKYIRAQSGTMMAPPLAQPFR